MSTEVRFTVADGRGKPVELTEYGWAHIVEGHPEMAGEEEAIRVTISDPDVVVRPKSRAKGRGIERRINARFGPHSRYSSLYLWVPIDYGPKRNWVLTAYLNPLPPEEISCMSESPLEGFSFVLDDEEVLRARYDEEGDVLYLWRGEHAVEAFGLTTEDGHLVRFHPETGEIVGFTIVDWAARWRDAGRLEINLPPLGFTEQEEEEAKTHSLLAVGG